MQPYPLRWPAGWSRTQNPKSSKFLAPTISSATKAIYRELRLMKATGAVITSNMTLTKNGTPHGRQPNIEDTGVAVYFTLKGKPRVMPLDTFIRIEDNLHAAAKSLGAIRDMERWGAAHMEAAMQGYTALPETASSANIASSWVEIMGLQDMPSFTLNDLRDAYKRLANKYHPDRPGGDAIKFNEMIQAYQEGLKFLRG
jgi:hypothetical protein